MSISEFGTKKA